MIGALVHGSGMRSPHLWWFDCTFTLCVSLEWPGGVGAGGRQAPPCIASVSGCGECARAGLGGAAIVVALGVTCPRLVMVSGGVCFSRMPDLGPGGILPMPAPFRQGSLANGSGSARLEPIHALGQVGGRAWVYRQSLSAFLWPMPALLVGQGCHHPHVCR